MNWLDRFRRKVGEPHVQVYDGTTGILSTIPTRELAPGMMRVKMEGVKGDCWVRPDQIHQSPYQHPPFDEGMRLSLHRIKEGLDEVYPLSLEEWEDGFRRDQDAEQEIRIWLHIAEVYVRLTEGKPLAAPERQDVLKILLCCANNPREQVLATTGLDVLSRPEAEAVMDDFYGR